MAQDTSFRGSKSRPGWAVAPLLPAPMLQSVETWFHFEASQSIWCTIAQYTFSKVQEIWIVEAETFWCKKAGSESEATLKKIRPRDEIRSLLKLWLKKLKP